MSALTPEPPFVWPEPRALEGICSYKHQPPIEDLALRSRAVFGVVSAITTDGIAAIDRWLKSNPNLRISLVVHIYPTCGTRQADLDRLTELVRRTSARVSVHVRPLEHVTDRGTNAICFLGPEPDVFHVVTGPSENLGLTIAQDGHINLAFRAEHVLIEAFRRSFDYMWANSPDITGIGGTVIPELVLPKGTDDAARLWRQYIDSCLGSSSPDGAPATVVHVDPISGDVSFRSTTDQEISSATAELGLEKLDDLAERISRVYSKGVLVSIDKLSRVPPLDAPLDPRTLGDASEIQKGNVTRKVSMRVSIIDEKMLKDLDRHRQGLRALLAKFTFGLADGMRWMPTAARPLFESELRRMNEEGQKLISDLLKGDVSAFIEGKREALVTDINSMYAELGRSGKVTQDVITRVVDSLSKRLTKAQSANFVPQLSYSTVSFVRTDIGLVSPWGQALSLLTDIVAFPRKALTDRFFFSGLKVSEDDLIEAMNVANDALCQELRARGIKERCRAELDLLSGIENASIEARDRCELTCRLLDGESLAAIGEALKSKEAA
jgi:hypothetical protein